jgi:hypothetical protein
MINNNMVVFAEDQSTSKEEDMTTNVTYEEDGIFSVIIPKTIVLGVDKSNATATYTVIVSGDIPSTKMVYVAPIDGIANNDNDDIDFYLKDQNTSAAKDDVVAKITQTKTYWSFEDVSGEGASTNGTITASNISAGSWTGTFNFTINLHSHTFAETIDGNVCVEEGTISYLCDECNYGYSEDVDSIGHDWQDDNSCSRCGLVAQPFTLTKSNMYMTGLVSQEYGDYDKIDELNGDIVIPETFEYEGTIYRISSIGDYAFGGCTNITSVDIPDSVTSIGNYAFCDCINMTSVDIPDNVTSIGNYAFCDCINMTSVDIPDNVTSIGDYAFGKCIGLTGDLVLPKNLTNIGEGAFLYCTGFTGDLIIPSSVTSVGVGAFFCCEGFTGNLIIPSSVTSIGVLAFITGASGLTNIIVDENNQYYDSRDNCNALIETSLNTLMVGCKNTIIPNDVETIGIYAFADCSGLTSVTLENNVKTIEPYAFVNCSSLTGNLEIPNSVTSIGKGAFEDCSGLTSVILGNSVASIGEKAFAYCSGLTGNLEIPNSMTSIGNSAFKDCSSLTGNLVIPDGMTSIGDSVFENCSSLTSVTLGNSVETIGSSAFSGCSNLTNVTLGNSVTSIGDSAFKGCSSLTGNLEIPDSVTSIGNYAFYNCSKLTNAILGNSVTSIGNSAFANCNSLKTVYIPKSVTTIGTSAFNSCPGTAKTYCEASEKQEGWADNWNRYLNTYPLLGAFNVSREQYDLLINPNEVNKLMGYSFSEVQAICQAGKAKEYFEVGDIAIITIDALNEAETALEAQTATIVVGDVTDTSITLLIVDYSTMAPQHAMNASNTNNGGWKVSDMRTWLNGEYLSALSSELQSSIKTHSSSYSETYNATEVSYCDDKIWLLSTKEVFGIQDAENEAAANAETQLAFFANGGGTVRYANSTYESRVWWWLRSSINRYNGTFCDVYFNGAPYSLYYAKDAYYVYPAFEIG